MTQFDTESMFDRRADNRWDRTCVGDVLERLTYSRPDKTAIVGWPGAFSSAEFESLTYRQADDMANRVAQLLRSHGVRRGERLLMICENSVEAYVAKIGAAKIGVVAAPLNPALAPDVVTVLTRRVDPAFVIVDAEIRPELVSAVHEAGARVDLTITIGGGPVPGSTSFADALRPVPATDPDGTVHGDDIWEILFTSGTTAVPKGVMLSHTYAHLSALGFALSLTRGLDIEADLVQCAFLPVVYHVADQVLSLSALLSGGTLVIGRRADPVQMAAAVVAHRATGLWGGSPQLVKAFSHELERLAPADRHLGVVVFGWGAVEPEVFATLQELGAPGLQLVGIFGQTESISCHRFWPTAWPEKYRAAGSSLNYVGIPSPLLASTVVDFEDNDLRATPGVPGETVYRSPVTMAGYYKDPEATQEAFRGGWFHSGDSCVVDDDGLRIMVDRYKDIIKSGGENVSSIRVEARLHQHPAVAKAAVIGLAHDRWGEAVTALVVLDTGASVDEEELVAWCRDGLAGFETPKSVVFVASLPETVGGKVLKYRLRQQLSDHYVGAPAGDQPRSEHHDDD